MQVSGRNANLFQPCFRRGPSLNRPDQQPKLNIRVGPARLILSLDNRLGSV